MSDLDRLAKRVPEEPPQKSLRETHPRLNVHVGWRLSARLRFLAQHHGVDVSELVSELLLDALERFEPQSKMNLARRRPWFDFEKRLAQADREEDAELRARAERDAEHDEWLRDKLS